jgi:hypothetical protein
MSRDDRIQQMEEHYLKHSSSVLRVDKALVDKYLKPALEAIQVELDGEVLKEYGILPDKEAQDVIAIFQQSMNDFLTEWCEWYFDRVIQQFQTIATKMIPKAAYCAYQVYLNKGTVTAEELSNSMKDSSSFIVPAISTKQFGIK